MKAFILLIFLSIAWTSQADKQVYCQGQQYIPTCPANNVLVILSANYSRLNSSICTENGAVTTPANCSASVVTFVRSQCEGKSTCRLPPEGSSFSSTYFGIQQPCSGIAKYLEVEWTCKLLDYQATIKTDEVTCGKSWYGKCEFGAVQIDSASYGRADSNTCSGNGASTCASNVTSNFVNACYGTPACAISASSLPTDCSASTPYFTVSWRCIPTPAVWTAYSGSLDPAGKVTFAATGDWGGQDGAPYITNVQNKLTKSMGPVAQSLNCSFIVGIGDNFYSTGIKSVDDPRFDYTFHNAWTHPALKVPWYMVAGNHDYYGNAKAEVEYTKKGTNWNFPNFSYDFVLPIEGTDRTVHVIFIDTFHYTSESHGNVPVDTAHAAYTTAWLTYTLRRSVSHWKFVFGHYPPYSASSHGPNADVQKVLDPLFEQYKVDFYSCGHDHNAQHITINKPTWTTEHFVVGGGHNFDANDGNAGRLPSKSLKLFYPPGNGGSVTHTCATDVFSAHCRLGVVGIQSATFGKRASGQTCANSGCSFSILDQLKAICNGKGCAFGTINATALGVVNDTCGTTADTAFLDVTWKCSATTETGAFSGYTVSPTHATVSLFSDDGSLIYQVEKVKMDSMELPPPPYEPPFYPEPEPITPTPTPTPISPIGTPTSTGTTTGTPNAPSTGTPNAPSTGTPNAPSTGTPNAPSTGTPNAPSTGTPNAPSTGTPNAPSTGTPNAPSTGTPNAPSSGTPTTDNDSTGAPSSGPNNDASSQTAGPGVNVAAAVAIPIVLIVVIVAVGAAVYWFKFRQTDEYV